MTASISKLPAPSINPPILSSGTVTLYRDSSWSSGSLTLNTIDYASTERHSIQGMSLQDATTWVAFNLPEGTVMTLSNKVAMPPVGGNKFDLTGLGQVVDLVGTGQTEGVDLTKLSMNDLVTMFFWRTVDLSQGAIELYADLDYTGNRTVIFLAEWPRDQILSVAGWYINDRATGARWSSLQGTKSTAKLFADPDGGGACYANIKGWGSFSQISNFSDVGFNDRISAFSWSAVHPQKEVVAPLDIDLGAYANDVGLSAQLSGHNDASTESEQVITFEQDDAETVSVRTTNTYTAGTVTDFTYEQMAFAGKITTHVQLSFSYENTNEVKNEVTKTSKVSVSQTFNVPAYSDYTATLTVYMGQIPDTTYATTAERWYLDQLPGSELDPANGWYKKIETVTLQLHGQLACKTQMNIKATPIPK